MTIFVDLCGVLADFDSHYESRFGAKPAPDGSDIDWDKVKAAPDFYPTLPKMTEFDRLWGYISPLNPVVLTTIPLALDWDQNAKDKTDWVRTNCGTNELVICPPGLKSEQAWPGNILIDNREKYRARWEARGAVFMLYSDAYTIGRTLNDMGIIQCSF